MPAPWRFRIVFLTDRNAPSLPLTVPNGRSKVPLKGEADSMKTLVNYSKTIPQRVWLLCFLLIMAVGTIVGIVAQRATKPNLTASAKAGLAQLDGTLTVKGLHEPVDVLRDTWGVPHIYAKNTEDLFFAQGFTVAQDRMWQLEMWRRNGQGKLAEVLGPDYVNRDKFARLLQFRGNWDEEFKKYHPDGRGINAAIQLALDQRKIPVEFQIMDFRPAPEWTAETVLTRMPGWTLSRNASSEVSRALNIKAFGVAKTEELYPTLPEKKIEIPAGLDLNDITPGILEVTRDANDLRWSITPDLGSNNWVIDGTKSTTGMPILANDPHREVVNPALRYVVHLNAPGWNVLGATEPGLPGVSIGHNAQIGWSFTILGMDQQDLYVEETDPNNPNRYLYKGEWYDMQAQQEHITVKGKPTIELAVKSTRHGPVLYEDTNRHRAFALKWVGSEPGGAGYIGSLNVMQAKNWSQFNAGVAKAWYIPSHSLVYADVEGNIGYRGVALTPIRKGWDGLLPVPGKDGKYEWQGYVPYNELPLSFNSSKHYYTSSNNDVVPTILPNFKLPLGYEYTLPYRFNRISEVLSANRKFSVSDMEKLQHDTLSIPARELVPLLRGVKTNDPELETAIKKLLAWDFVLDRNSTTAPIYEYWVMKLQPNAYRPRVPESARSSFRSYSIDRVIHWMKSPDAAYGPDAASQVAARDQILLTSLKDGLADLKKQMGDNMDQWQWGKIHTADFVHPLASYNAEARTLFGITPVPRGGDAFTVMATSSPTERNTKQTSGASFMFVFDVQNWDRSTGLSTPGNSAQPLSPHYGDLASDYWGDGKYFPLMFSRQKIEENTKNRLVLQPEHVQTSSGHKGR
jgi:penicillin amidase